MWTFTRRFALVAVVAVLGVGLLSARAQAGPFRLNRYGATYIRSAPPINRNWIVAPGLSLQQWAYNTSVIGRAYANVPPYALGYNPYPSVVNYGPTLPTVYNGVNPYAVYSGMYNPYAYGAYANPYGVYGYSYLYP